MKSQMSSFNHKHFHIKWCEYMCKYIHVRRYGFVTTYLKLYFPLEVLTRCPTQLLIIALIREEIVTFIILFNCITCLISCYIYLSNEMEVERLRQVIVTIKFK